MVIQSKLKLMMVPPQLAENGINAARVRGLIPLGPPMLKNVRTERCFGGGGVDSSFSQ